MSAFAQAVAQKHDEFHRRGCSMGHALQGMAKKDRAEVEAALDDPRVMTSAIVEGLKAMKVTGIKSYTVQRHRKHDCSCG